MKLSAHQKEIITEIINGTVYDISSYLKVFKKSQEQQYDINLIEKTFEEHEDGKTYIFKENTNAVYYTEVYDKNGKVCGITPITNTMTYEFKEYPLSEPLKASLKHTVDSEKVLYNDTAYYFNFLKNKFFVADSFNDIIDFMALWSYLKRETLILEVDKPIEQNDLSIFFELKKKEIKSECDVYWERYTEVISEATDGKKGELSIKMLPYKDAKNYIDYVWKINEENLLNCKEYIGKKIIPSSDLRVYKQKKFKTVEQISQFKNLFVAWAAVIISVISVIIGNILPMFQPKEIDVLNGIRENIIVIEESITKGESFQALQSEIEEINNRLEEIKQQNNDAYITDVLKDLTNRLDDLNEIVSKIDNQ